MGAKFFLHKVRKELINSPLRFLRLSLRSLREIFILLLFNCLFLIKCLISYHLSFCIIGLVEFSNLMFLWQKKPLNYENTKAHQILKLK